MTRAPLRNSADVKVVTLWINGLAAGASHQPINVAAKIAVAVQSVLARHPGGAVIAPTRVVNTDATKKRKIESESPDIHLS
jgi:hypothetical protein